MNTILTLINNSSYNNRFSIRSLRLSVRTRGFHPRKRGSIPLGTAIIMSFYVYMLLSIDRQKNKTYVGYTTNLERRIVQHNTNKGAKSTKGYKWKIIFKKKFLSKSKALSFEFFLKKDRKRRLLILNNYDKKS